MWTIVKHHRLWVLAAGAVLAMFGTGCDNNLKTENDALKAQNTELQTRLNETTADLEAKNKRIAELTDQVAKGAQAPAAPDALTQGSAPKAVTGSSAGGDDFGGLNVTRSSKGVTVHLASDVLFDSGKATLKSTSQKALNQVAAAIKKSYSHSQIRVEGYTDSDPIRKSSWPSNEALSQARADAVKKYLASQGVKNIVSVGMGSANPKGSKAASRRVEIVIAK
jgi:type VI secretion system protein ImpK